MTGEKLGGSDNLPTEAASDYLRSRGVTVAPTTLKQWRYLGRGPAYHREISSGRVFYRQPDLDAFSTSSMQRIEPGAKAVEAGRSAEARQPSVTQPSV